MQSASPTRLESFPPPFRAAVIGATGGLGAAFVSALHGAPGVSSVLRFARRAGDAPDIIALDVTDEASIARAAASITHEGRPLRLVVIATGMLTDDGGTGPEKSIRELGAARLAHSFAVNAIGPALVMRHFAPLLAREGKVVMAALSARVGSISDNRLGGWYGYRASKAALNQLIRTAAIEIGARRRDACVLALHPGTVATGLSRPFVQASDAKVRPPAEAANALLRVIDEATPQMSGTLLGWDGAPIPF
jgi:NAD(P)-dependent dehydrogenase (short-subunit alcohol dehydrogenase family)